jgi:hypothetical protein
MPKQQRWYIKQELGYAIGNLDSAEDKIAKVAKPFEHVHDDYFDKFVKILASIHVTKEVIQQLKDEI